MTCAFYSKYIYVPGHDFPQFSFSREKIGAAHLHIGPRADVFSMDEEVLEEEEEDDDGPGAGAAHRAQIFSMDEEEAEDSFVEDGKRLSGGGGNGIDRLHMYDNEEQEFRGSSTPRGVMMRRAPSGSKGAVTPRGSVHSVRFGDDVNDEQQEELQRAQELARVSGWVGGWVGTYVCIHTRVHECACIHARAR